LQETHNFVLNNSLAYIILPNKPDARAIQLEQKNPPSYLRGNEPPCQNAGQAGGGKKVIFFLITPGSRLSQQGDEIST
jgi:hypothetical protein